MNRLYFKPLKELHENGSGYRKIEIGYVNENNEAICKGICSDVILFGLRGDHEMPRDLNIDVDPNGRINFWSDKDYLRWRFPITSNAIVEKAKEDRFEI